MDDCITRKEHEEFARRMESENSRLDDENRRTNQRLILLENTVSQINALTVSVERMAVNMGNMLTELEKQGKRIEKIEKEPAEAHKAVKSAITTALIGAVVGAAVTAVLALL